MCYPAERIQHPIVTSSIVRPSLTKNNYATEQDDQYTVRAQSTLASITMDDPQANKLAANLTAKTTFILTDIVTHTTIVM